eukprot:5512997-Karenia_brevis.AAC.1
MLIVGSLAQPKQVNAFHGLSIAARALCEDWPSAPHEETASGQGDKELWVALAEARAGVCGLLQDIAEKTNNFLSNHMNARVKQVQELADRASQLLGTLHLTDEKEFRSQMKKLGNQVAKRQSDIQCALQGMAEEADSGQKDFAGVREQAQAIADRCMFFTCTYVAMTLWSQKSLRTAGPTGAT